MIEGANRFILTAGICISNGGEATLSVEQAVWQAAADLVYADVAATTSLRWKWKISKVDEVEATVQVDTEPMSITGAQLQVRDIGSTPPTQRLPAPELRFETEISYVRLQEKVLDLADAVEFLANAIQDMVIDQLQTAWPKCPGHTHPMTLGGRRRTSWACPDTGKVIADVGQLAVPM